MFQTQYISEKAPFFFSKLYLILAKLENEKEFFAQTMFHCHNEKSNSKTSPIFKLEPMWKGSDATLKLTWICVIFAIFLEDWWVMKFERNIR